VQSGKPGGMLLVKNVSKSKSTLDASHWVDMLV